MKVRLASAVLGSSRDLVVDLDSMMTVWAAKGEDARATWTLGIRDSTLSIEDAADALGVKLVITPGDKWIRPWAEMLRCEVDPCAGVISWVDTLPPDVFQEYILSILGCLRKVLCDPRLATYLSTLEKTRKTILCPIPARIDRARWNESLALGTAPSDLTPDRDGFADVVVYDRATTTGRVRVVSGPNYLTMKKKDRQLLTSRFPGGSIVQIDHVSLEPRVALSLVGRPIPDDVHTHVANEILGGIVTRNQSKVLSMSVLFGAGPAKVSSVLGTKLSVDQLMSEVRSFFGVHVLESKLKRQLKEEGFITNHFGRVMVPSRRDAPYLVSLHVQSTGADVCFLGFHAGLAKIEEEKIRAVPIALIHDAMLLDVHPDDMVRLQDVITAIENGSGLEKFPVALSVITRRDDV